MHTAGRFGFLLVAFWIGVKGSGCRKLSLTDAGWLPCELLMGVFI